MVKRNIESSETTIRRQMVAVLAARLVEAMAVEATDSPTYWPQRSRANPASRSRRRLHQERSRRRLVAYLLDR